MEIINENGRSLDSILQEQIDKLIDSKCFNVCESKIVQVPCNGSNFTGAIYLINLKDKQKGNIELFAKIAQASKVVRVIMPVDEMYKREIFIYKEIALIYNTLQEKNNVPDEEKFKFAKYYASNDKWMEEAIILENMLVKGYCSMSHLKFFDWEYASKAIKELAKLHALSFAFEKDNPELFSEIVVVKDDYMLKRPYNKEHEKKIHARLLKTISDRINPENAEKCKKFLDTFDRNIWSELTKKQRRSVLIHGDYRQSNLLGRYENNKLMDLIPVDYQRASYGSPITDILYFVFTGTDEEFRANYFELIFEHYYESLTDYLKLLDLNVQDIYPKEEYDLDIKEQMLYGFLVSFFFLPFILTEEKPDLDKSLNEFSMNTSETYFERFNGIVNDYAKWGYL